MSKKSPKVLRSPVTIRETVFDAFGVRFQGDEEGIMLHKICLKGYKLKKYIAEGSYGVVYQACDMKKTCNYVVKIQQLDFHDETKMDDWLRETEITGMLSMKYDIGPKFLGAWLCEQDQVGIIVSELWDGTLFGCPSKELINKLQQQIDTINNLGYVHGDILPKNILVKKDSKGKIIDITLTDFGTVNTVKQWKKDEKNYGYLETFYEYHTNSQNVTKFYYKDNRIKLADVIENPMYLDKSLMYYFDKFCNKK